MVYGELSKSIYFSLSRIVRNCSFSAVRRSLILSDTTLDCDLSLVSGVFYGEAGAPLLGAFIKNQSINKYKGLADQTICY